MAARELARGLLAVLHAERPNMLTFDSVDLAPAAEQALFLALRVSGPDPIPLARSDGAHPLARTAFAVASSLAHRRLPHVGGRVAAIVSNPAHREILRPIALRLGAISKLDIVEMSDVPLWSRTLGVPRLSDYLVTVRIRELLAKQREIRREARIVPELFGQITDSDVISRASRVVVGALHRAALDVACIGSVAQARPALIIAFDEIGRRARTVGPTARRYGVPSLDLPHAEAADPHAIRGATYDMFGVFGPRAREVMLHAGISEDRVREVGPSRFDALVHRGPHPLPSSRRVVFASQWLTGQMSADVKRETLRIAIQGVAAAAPCELVIRPHPLERDSIAEELLALGVPDGVSVRIERSVGLYDLLDGAWALITGWSNSVFEGLVANIPAVCITPTGLQPPTRFVEDGLAIGATSTKEAKDAIARLVDPQERMQLLVSARQALQQHIGPLDGRASERAAALIIELVA